MSIKSKPDKQKEKLERAERLLQTINILEEKLSKKSVFSVTFSFCNTVTTQNTVEDFEIPITSFFCVIVF